MSTPTNPESTNPEATEPVAAWSDPTAEMPMAAGGPVPPEPADHPDTTATTETTETTSAAAAPPASVPAPQQPAPSSRPTGPSAPGIVLAIICLAVAGVVLAEELGGLTVDWGHVGPLGVVATGAVLVALGIVGLLSSRRRDHG